MDVSEDDGLTFRLTTKRLVLRPLTGADAPDLARIGGTARVARMFRSIQSPWPAEALFEWIERARWTGKPGYRLGICLPEGALIGTVGFGGDPLELGYFLAEDQVGKGYATEATHAVLADAFARFGMEAVVAEHFDDNPSSGYVLRKLGFVEVGQGMSQSGARAAPAPCSFFKLTRAAFVQAGAGNL